jgi:hypothetical protein
LAAALAVALVLAACQPAEPPPPPPPGPSTIPAGEPGVPAGEPGVLAELRGRPVVLPRLGPAGECPVTPAVEPTPAPPPDGPIASGGSAMFGTAPVAPLARYFPDDRLPIAEADPGWYAGTSHWAARPGYRGWVLVRAFRIDGPGRARVELRTRSSPGAGADAVEVIEDWQFWTGGTQLTGPGCYAYQIAGDGFTELVVFRAELA